MLWVRAVAADTCQSDGRLTSPRLSDHAAAWFFILVDWTFYYSHAETNTKKIYILSTWKRLHFINCFYSKPDVLSSAMRDLTLSVEGVEQTLVAVSPDFDCESTELNSSITACPERVSGRVNRKLTQVCSLIAPLWFPKFFLHIHKKTVPNSKLKPSVTKRLWLPAESGK